MVGDNIERGEEFDYGKYESKSSVAQQEDNPDQFDKPKTFDEDEKSKPDDHTEGNVLEIKVSGLIECILPDISEQCGKAKARFTIDINTSNSEEFYTLPTAGQIALTGTAIGNPGNILAIIADEPLQSNYDALGRQLQITGVMVDLDGNRWTLDGKGPYDLGSKDESKINLILNLVGPTGEKFIIPTSGDTKYEISGEGDGL